MANKRSGLNLNIFIKITKRYGWVFALFFLHFCILSSYPAIAQPVTGAKKISPAAINHPEFKKNLKQLFVPEKSGFVTEVFVPEKSAEKLVFVMQDPHTNIKAQFNEADIYDFLAREYQNIFPGKKPLIALEGTPDVRLDYSTLTSRPEDPSREEVADFLVYEGKLNGSEYYKVRYNPAAEIAGIEDMALYTENVMAFKKARDMKSQLSFSLRDLRKAVNELKRRVYSYFLKKLDETIQSFDSHPERIKEHFASLEGLAKVKNISLGDYPAYATMKKLMDEENKIARAKLKEELAALGIFQMPFSFESKQEGRKFTEQLTEALDRAPGAEGTYPESRRYLDYLNATLSIDAESFFGDLEKIYSALFDVFAESQREKDTAERDRSLRLVEKLWDLEMTDEEYLYFKSRREELTDPAYWKKLNKYSADFLIDYRVKDNIYEVMLVLKESEHFYETAFARNQALFNNLMRQMTDRGASAAFLVTGGFHARGLAELFRQNGIAYALIVPQIDLEQDTSLYWKTLSGETMSVEKIIRYFTTMPASAYAEGSPTGTYSALLRFTRLAENPEAAREYSATQNTDIQNVLNAAQITVGGTNFTLENPAGDTVTLNVRTNVVEEDTVRDLMRPGESDVLRAAHPIRAGPDTGKFLFVNITSSVLPNQAPLRITSALAEKITNQLGGIIISSTQTSSSFLAENPESLFNVQVFFPEQSAEFQQTLVKNPRGKAGSVSLVAEGVPQTVTVIKTPLIQADDISDTSRPIVDGVQIEKAPELSAGEVESILAQVIEQLPETVSGQSLGKFTVGEKLGEGGFGVVFKATNDQGKHFAIKISSRPLDENRQEKWTREALLLKSVSDKTSAVQNNVPKYLDHGFLPELKIGNRTLKNVAYLAMELLEGDTIQKRFVANARQSPDFSRRFVMDVLETVQKAADSLGKLHARGIVHRDIKTENLFLANDRSVKILDFGLALDLTTEEGQAALRASGGVGTAGFMAPETLNPDKSRFGKIGAPTDIFALGTTLYYLLSGKFPIDLERDDFFNVMFNLEKHKEHTDFEKFKNRIRDNLQEERLEINLPERLLKVLHKSLAPRTEDRYPDGEAFAKDLKRVLEEMIDVLNDNPAAFDVEFAKTREMAAFEKTREEAPPLSGAEMRTQDFPSLDFPSLKPAAGLEQKKSPVQEGVFSIPLLSSEDSAAFFDTLENSESVDGASLGRLKDILDRSVRLKRLGEGGFGTVYLATTKDGRRIAVKIPSKKTIKTYDTREEAAAADEKLMENFKRDRILLKEAQVSDHVVRYFGMSIFKKKDEKDMERKLPVLVMELLEDGETLGQKYVRQPPSYQDKPLFERLADIYSTAVALDDYHEKTGQINADIKPENIFIGKDGIARLFDLSLAFRENDIALNEEEIRNGKINSKTMRGTPMYVAPEMAKGVKSADQRSDIFSLGVTAFGILTARHPHDFRNDENFYHRVSKLKSSDLQTFDRALSKSNLPEDAVPEAVQRIIYKALEADPSARYQTAGEFARDLGRVVVDLMIDDALKRVTGRDITWQQHYGKLREIEKQNDFQREFRRLLNNSAVPPKMIESDEMQILSGLAYDVMAAQEAGLADLRIFEKRFSAIEGRSLGAAEIEEAAPEDLGVAFPGRVFDPASETEVRRVLEAEGLDPALAPSIQAVGNSLGAKKAVIPGFKEVKTLGEGTFGLAVLMQDRANNLVVVKFLKNVANSEHRKLFSREVDALKRLTNAGVKNIPQFRGAFDARGKPAMGYPVAYAMEYVEGTDLMSYVSSINISNQSKEQIYDFLREQLDIFGLKVAAALSQIHSTPSLPRPEDGKLFRGIHNDIKPENMLITKDKSRIIILDPGLITSENEDMRHIYGTPVYMSPEKLGVSMKYNDKEMQEYFDNKLFNKNSRMADRFALGVSLYKALTGHYPVDAPTFEQLGEKWREVLDGKIAITPPSVHLANKGLELPKALADRIDNLLLRLVHPNPFERVQNLKNLEEETRSLLNYMEKFKPLIVASIKTNFAQPVQLFEDVEIIDSKAETVPPSDLEPEPARLGQEGLREIGKKLQERKRKTLQLQPDVIDKIRAVFTAAKEKIFGKPDMPLQKADKKQRGGFITQVLPKGVEIEQSAGASLGQAMAFELYKELSGGLLDAAQIPEGAQAVPLNVIDPKLQGPLNEFVMRGVYGEFPSVREMNREFSERILPSLQASDGIEFAAEGAAAPSAGAPEISLAGVDPKAMQIYEGVSAFQGENAGVVFVRYNKELLDRMLDSESKTAFDSNRAGIVFLVADSKQFNELKKDFPPAAQQKGIAIALYPKLAQADAGEGLGNLARSDIQNVISRRAADLIQSLLRNAAVTEMNLDNVAIVSAAFSDKVGDEPKRLRYNAEEFETNPEYAAAHSLGAAYLALGLSPDGLFDKDPQTGDFILSRSVIDGLIAVMKSKRMVAVMA